MPPLNTSGTNTDARLISAASTSYSYGGQSGTIDSVTSPAADIGVRTAAATGITDISTLRTIPPN